MVGRYKINGRFKRSVPGDARLLDARDIINVMKHLVRLQREGVEPRRTEPLAERSRVVPTTTADHPVRLALAIATEIKNRYGFDLTAVGFVRGDRVEVMAISGQDEVRPAHPGVQLIRAAMEECLDRRRPVVCCGSPDLDEPGDARLHAQWSTTLDRDPVASFPLQLLDEVVAVVSMSRGAATHLDHDRVVRVAEEMSGYAALVPLSRRATRSLSEHAADSIRSSVKTFLGRGRLRVISTLVILISVSAYAAPSEDLNLRKIEALAHAFDVPAGFSDHSEGAVAAVVAATSGACVIEKDFTLDKNLPGPDHRFSSDPSRQRKGEGLCKPGTNLLPE